MTEKLSGCMVNIEIYELKNLLMEAAAMGAAMVQKPNDVMRQKEAEAYMVAQGYAKSKLGELVAHGLVRFHRLSEAKNSPSVCSRVELMAAVSALNKRTINFKNIRTMDEKFMKEQEAKAFDEQLANDRICSLQDKLDDLLEFIAMQSVNCYESDCRRKAIEGMGRKAYLSFLIKKGEQDALEDEDWDYIVELINKD